MELPPIEPRLARALRVHGIRPENSLLCLTEAARLATQQVGCPAPGASMCSPRRQETGPAVIG